MRRVRCSPLWISQRLIGDVSTAEARACRGVGVVGFRYPAVIEAVDELTALAVRLLGSRDLVAATGEVLGGDIDA